MPELPEVETIKQNLQESELIGKKISTVLIFSDKCIEGTSPNSLVKELSGQIFIGIERKAKFLIFRFSSSTLLLHLRMSGKLSILKESKPLLKHERARIIFNNGQALCFEDQRKFGRIYLLDNLDEKLGRLGIEPLTPLFTLQNLKKTLKQTQQKIKATLLDQRKISGLGNIYADESLWEAKIHPEQISSRLTDKEIEKLFHAVQKVIQCAVQRKGTSLGIHASNYRTLDGNSGQNQNYLQAYGRKGLPCFRCSEEIVKIKSVQRGTYFCPECQPLKEFDKQL